MVRGSSASWIHLTATTVRMPYAAVQVEGKAGEREGPCVSRDCLIWEEALVRVCLGEKGNEKNKSK